MKYVSIVLETVLSVTRWTSLGHHLHARVGLGCLAVVTSTLGTAGLVRTLKDSVSLLSAAIASSSSSSRRLLILVLGRELVILQPSESLLSLPLLGQESSHDV